MKELPGIISEPLKHWCRCLKYSHYKDEYSTKKELERIRTKKRYTPGQTKILGQELEFIDGPSFYFMYNEIFQKQIFKFKSQLQRPYIIDAGANIGLSVIFFKQSNPAANIVAFEPDKSIFKILKSNINKFNYKDINIINKALWDSDEPIEFMTEGADAGRIAFNGENTNILKVETTRLSNYLTKKVDFLKIDIEGAELRVLKEAQNKLKMVERIFLEYHSLSNSPQQIHEILSILKNAGFRFQIFNTSNINRNPFINTNDYMGMDMQLDIYGYRI